MTGGGGHCPRLEFIETSQGRKRINKTTTKSTATQEIRRITRITKSEGGEEKKKGQLSHLVEFRCQPMGLLLLLGRHFLVDTLTFLFLYLLQLNRSTPNPILCL